MNRLPLSRPSVLTALAIGLGAVLAGALVMTRRVAADPASFAPAPVVPLAAEPPARLFVDSPLPEPLARGLFVVRYRTENVRLVPVFGPAARDVSPRLGHLHVTLDAAPWHWVDASGEPLIIQWLPPGPHELRVELADPTHAVIDRATVRFDVPPTPANRH